MGDYTGLRCRVRIKQEFAPMIEWLSRPYKHGAPRGWRGLPIELRTVFTLDWSKVGRCDFIPYGALAYMPWDEDDPQWQSRFVDNVWTFQCSLKNTENEIETFFDLVLSKIIEPVEPYIEVLYEYWDRSKFYVLKDDQIIFDHEGEERL